MKTYKEIFQLTENKQQDMKRAKEYVERTFKKLDGDYKKIRKHILDNVVNSAYGKESNNYIDILWAELEKKFPS
jgi:hypothetical protein